MDSVVLPQIGIGLRHPHYDDALRAPQGIDFVELHAENLYPKGGLYSAFVDQLCQTFPVSIHGTSLGLGSAVEVPEHELNKFADVVSRTSPFLVSEHICFNRANVHGRLFHTGDLLPIPYNAASLTTLSENVQTVQHRLGCSILLENLSAYLPDIEHTLTETEFLNQLVEQTQCGLLLDLNNVLVNLHNQYPNWDDAQRIDVALNWIDQLPHTAIREIHLAGFSPQQVHGLYVDDHAQPVSSECWTLYAAVLAKIGAVTTLIEWDNNLPAWTDLVAQAEHARAVAKTVLAPCGTT
jgi:uncharacterized protein (UPF0276 family)